MFFFVNFQSAHQTNYEKGLLFEGLVKEIVSSLGYKDIELRVKKAGKEYDVKAKAKLGNRLLIGQAKAYEAAINSQIMSEFVGSLDLEDFPEDALGLFVSTSDLTPDAKEFIQRLKKGKRDRIELIASEQISSHLTVL